MHIPTLDGVVEVSVILQNFTMKFEGTFSFVTERTVDWNLLMFYGKLPEPTRDSTL